MTLDELARLTRARNHLVRIRFALVCKSERPTYTWDAASGRVFHDEFGGVFVSLNSVREALEGFVARAETEHEKPRFDRASVVVVAYTEAELDACDAIDEDLSDASQLHALKEGFAQVMDELFTESRAD